MRRIVISVVVVIVIAVGFFFAVFGSALRQNEAHLSVLWAIAKLEITRKEVEPIGQAVVLVRVSRQPQAIIDYTKKKGWEYVEQMGSGLVFENNGQKVTIEARQYTKHFQLINVSPIAASL